MPVNLDPNFLNLITQIMGGVSSKVNNAVLGTPMPTQGTPQSTALTDLAQKRAQAGQQVLGGVLSGPSAAAQAAPAAPRKPQGALSPLQQVEIGRPVVEAYADDGAAQGPQQNAPALNLESFAAPPDLSMGPQQNQPALNLAQYEQGILGKIGDAVGPNFLGRLGDGLLVAGSQDPARALAQVSAQRAEEAEAQAKRAAAGRPKVVPIQGGAFSLVTFPDGSMQSIPNKDVMEFQKRVAEQQRLGKIDQAVLQAHLTQLAGQTKIDDKVAAEARPQLLETSQLIEKYKEAIDVVMPVQTGPDGQPVMGPDGQPLRNPRSRWAQAQAIPLVKTGAEFFGTDAAADNLLLQALQVDETLLNTARTKGAISNQEMSLFKSPLPTPYADPKVFHDHAQRRMAVLEKIKAFQESEVARGSSPSPQTPPQQVPQVAPKAGGMAVPGLSERASKYFN